MDKCFYRRAPRAGIRLMSLICCALLAGALTGEAVAAVRHLTPEYQKLLRARHRFHVLLQAGNLPPPVLALCADERGKLADPRAKWQSGTALGNGQLPAKRLIWAVTDGTHFVVHYERAAPTHRYHVMIASSDPTGSHAQLVWRARLDKALPSFKALLDALDEDALEDSPARDF